ncbi:hypothetical protein SHIRM173S_03746 [Streptomyces hirsutus]
MPDRSKGSAPPSPRSSGSPRTARSTRRRWSPVGTSTPQTFGGFTEGTYLPLSVHGYFANGGGAAYIVRIGGQADALPSVDGGRRGNVAAEPVAFGGFLVAAKPGVTGISVEVADADGENPPEDRFKVLVRQGDQVAETYEASTRKNVKGYLVNQARASKLIQVTEQQGAAQSQARHPDPCRARRPGRARRERRRRRWPVSTRRSTSATPPLAPGSAAWRPSTRSPWSPCRT